MNQDNLRKLPSIDQVMIAPSTAVLTSQYGRSAVVNAARQAVESIRLAIFNGRQTPVDVQEVVSTVSRCLSEKYAPSIRHGVNATGIILHTGLGRAMLAEKAVDQIVDVIRGYSTLAVDPEFGQRESRDVHVSKLLCELTGAEAATVANNNAAATMLILNTLAKGKEVIVSRGQLVEIGGSFRMPDVMETSGAILREVGTTNKTHLRDYANAINENTGAILRVHTSNYRILGFTEEPSIQDIVKLAKRHNLPVIDDLGSGALVDLKEYGLETEPLVRESIYAGVDVACFSGDKLIGGPQCGIIVGKSSSIKQIKKNPLARALRVDKMTVAGLEATLKIFLNPDRLNLDHPTYRMFSAGLEELDARAQSMAASLSSKLGDNAFISVVDGESQVGSGSVPTETIPSRLLGIRPRRLPSENLIRILRFRSTPVFARIHQDTLLFDFRTIQPIEDSLVEEAILDVLLRKGANS